MDNLCHTLVGAALAQSGLKKRSPLGTATLLIAANLPDVDVISLAWGSSAGLAFRRGWTHGLLALSLWPFLLAGLMVAYDRLVAHKGARFRPLLLLAAIGVLSHPLLDQLNTYGVRWLMPFSGRWFYGDTLFIIDIWAWLMLGIGVALSVRRERKQRPDSTRPARAALLAATAYTAAMFTLGRLAASQARFELRAAGAPVQRVLASPLPVTPFLRDIVVDEGDAYLVGRLRTGHNLRVDGHWPRRIPGDEEEDPAVSAAAATEAGATFLGWARYPTYVVDRRGGMTVVHFIDLRYARHPGAQFGTVAIPVTSYQVAAAGRRAFSCRAPAAPGADAATPTRDAPPSADPPPSGECRRPG